MKIAIKSFMLFLATNKLIIRFIKDFLVGKNTKKKGKCLIKNISPLVKPKPFKLENLKID